MTVKILAECLDKIVEQGKGDMEIYFEVYCEVHPMESALDIEQRVINNETVLVMAELF